MSTLSILNATEQELNYNVSWSSSSSFQLLAAYLTTEYFNNISSVSAGEILLETHHNNNNNNNYNKNINNNNNYNNNNNNKNGNSSTIIEDYGTIINTNNNFNNDDEIFNNIINENNIISNNNIEDNINIGTDLIPINNYDININLGSYIGYNINDTININNITNITISTIEKSIRNNNIANIINNGNTITTSGGSTTSSGSSTGSTGMGNLQISLYAIIFMLAIVGNLLVILTLVQNRRMRTITNLFLLNLAISDILLGVLCMPPTLVGALLRDFIFGRFMCKVLPYLQACSVSVSAWTLVAISCERYYAICHPLRSRTWQTLKHAYKLIALIWIGSLFLLSPIAYLSKLIPTAKGGHKCREEWPTSWKQPYEKIFNIYLDIILLIIPVLVLTLTYSLISRTLWHGMRAEKAPKGTQSTDNLMEVFINKNGSPSNRSFVSYRTASKDNLNLVGNLHQFNGNNSFMQNPMLIKEFSYSTRRKHGLRRTNIEKSLQNKKRVIKMLFMVVLEFFLCWTPLYVINTIALFSPDLIYSSIGYAGISFFQLLAYSSSCCNPITYCFMNRGFRKAFLNLFRCFKRFRSPKRKISIGGGGTQETDLEISRLQCQRLCTDSTISY